MKDLYSVAIGSIVRLTKTCEFVLVFVFGSLVTGGRPSTVITLPVCTSRTGFCLTLTFGEIMRVINVKSWLLGRVSFLRKELRAAKAAKADVARYRQVRGCPRSWWRAARVLVCQLKRALAAAKAQLQCLLAFLAGEKKAQPTTGLLVEIQAQEAILLGAGNIDPLAMSDKEYDSLFNAIMAGVDTSGELALTEDPGTDFESTVNEAVTEGRGQAFVRMHVPELGDDNVTVSSKVMSIDESFSAVLEERAKRKARIAAIREKRASSVKAKKARKASLVKTKEARKAALSAAKKLFYAEVASCLKQIRSTSTLGGYFSPEVRQTALKWAKGGRHV